MKMFTIKNKPKIAIIQDLGKHSFYKSHKTDYNLHTKAFVCNWADLKGKIILNKNVLIDGFNDVHPFSNPPIFEKAENIYLRNNYKYFHYYWLYKEFFPTNPLIYLRGPLCGLNRGFKIYISENYYHRVIRYAKDIGADISLIHEISENEYDANVDSYDIEDIQLIDNAQCDKKEYDEITEKDLRR